MARERVIARRITEQEDVEEMKKSKPDFSNMVNCVNDVKKARLDSDTGPADPTEFGELRGSLEACRERLPSLYREEVYKPYVGKLDWLGPEGFNKILLKDPEKALNAGLMLDIAQAIIQNGTRYCEKATDAFQEVVSDLYDGFLSEEEREGVKKPDLSVIPPLVKWGCPEEGPYTWSAASTRHYGFGKQAAIVNLPPAHSRCGLLAWAALGHETAGHDVLMADNGLLPELADAVSDKLQNGNVGEVLPDYWAYRINETASDVLGILNMGPAAGIGQIVFFRGWNAAAGLGPVLENVGSLSPRAVHPVDILRGYLAASVVRQLNFGGREDWAKAIEAETDKDLGKIQLGSPWSGYKEISPEDAKRSAEIVAKTLVNEKMKRLENHSLGQIQNWNDEDEWIAIQLRSILTKVSPLPKNYEEGVYAAHAVAAAVSAALAGDADIPLIFDRMLGMLKTMHDANPSWGPMYIAYPGDLVFLRARDNL